MQFGPWVVKNGGMKVVGIIPARYASTRFPGKPLALIAGKPLIQHVVERCQKARSLSEILVTVAILLPRQEAPIEAKSAGPPGSVNGDPLKGTIVPMPN